MRLQFVPVIKSARTSDWACADLDSGILCTDTYSGTGVRLEVGRQATVVVDYDTMAVQVTIEPDPEQTTLQRINKMLDGSGLKLRAYHRMGGAVALHASTIGKYLPLPQVIDYDPERGFRFSEMPAPKVAAVTPAVRLPEPVASSITVVEPEQVTAVEPALVIPPTAGTDLLQHPVFDFKSEVRVKRDVVEGLDILWDMHSKGMRQVVCFIGPTGTGKTSLVYNLAARQKVGIFNFDCAGAREFSDFVGVTHLRGTVTQFVPSALLEVIRADGPYAGIPRIVNLDEITRAESAQALNALISILHDFSRINVPEAGRAFDLDPAVMYTFTANRGAQYTGTVGLDLALANRVTAWVKMEYADPKVEQDVLVERTGIAAETAVRLVGAAKRIRDMDERGELPEGGGISTRLLIKAAEKVVGGFTPHAAAMWTWVGNYSDEGGTQSEAYQVTSAIDLTLR